MDDEPVKDAGLYVSQELDGDCSLDPEQFKNILDKDIQAQIDCLNSKFKQFSSYVRSSDRTVIDQGELQDFVSKFFEGNAETIIQGLGLIFELNMILLRDESGSISRDNITPLFQLLLKVNQEAMITTKAIKEIIDDKEGKNFWQNRKVLEESIKRFSRDTLSIITLNSKLPKKINIKTFLTDLEGRLGLKVDVELVDSLIFIKRLFLGGDKYILTSDELVDLVVKSPRLIMMALDLALTSEKNFKSKKTDAFAKERDTQKKYVNFFQENVLILSDLMSTNLNDQDEIFNIEELFKAARRMQALEGLSLRAKDSSTLDLDDYEKIIVRVKEDLIGGDKNIVNVKEFRTILVYANMLFESVKFGLDYEVITKDIDKLSYADKKVRKAKFMAIVDQFLESIKKTCKKRSFIPDEIFILNFVKQLNATIPEIQYDVKLYESLLALKRLALGGTKSVLTRDEFYRGLDKLRNTADLFFNASYLITGLDEKTAQYKFGLEQVKLVKSLFHDWSSFELIMPIKDLLYLVEQFMDGVNATQFEPTIMAFKAKILQGQKNPDYEDERNKNISYGDIQSILTYAQEAFETLLFTEITYSHPSVEKNMRQSGVIRSVSFPRLKEYKVFDKYRLRDLKASFSFIAKNYRYFPDASNFTSYFSSRITRSKEGFAINSLLRWVLEKVAIGYSKKSETNPKLDVIDVDLLKKFLLDSRSLLEAFNLWTSDFSTFADNVILLGDLFQNQADGDNEMSVDEATEFVGILLSSVNITDKAMRKMKAYCAPLQGWPEGTSEDDVNTSEVTYESACYRSNFFKVIMDDLGFYKHFPKLARYQANTSKEDLSAFVESVETFARDVSTDNPMRMRDATLVMGAMLNIESTFVRFDADDDNQLTDDEMESAFGLYKNSIIKIAELTGWKVKLTKTILFYMVKYMKIPNEIVVLGYYAKGGVSDIEAQRLNIGSLLKNLVETRQTGKENNE